MGRRPSARIEPRTEAVVADRCRNCGQEAGPRYCGHCGQALDAGRRSVWALVRELATEWLSLEGRLVRTLAALGRPGRLTLLHLDGKRAPHLTPMRLYLLASLALFSSVLTLRAPDVRSVNLTIGGVSMHEASSASSTAKVNLELFSPRSTSMSLLSSGLSGQVERLRRTPPQEVVDTLFRGLRRVLPPALILCLPLLAAVLKLLYLRTGTLFADHLLFAVHFQSALFLALALAWVVGLLLRLGVGSSLLLYGLALLAMLVVYLPLALRRVYRQARWLTGLKTGLLIYGYRWLLGLALGVSYVWAMMQI